MFAHAGHVKMANVGSTSDFIAGSVSHQKSNFALTSCVIYQRIKTARKGASIRGTLRRKREGFGPFASLTLSWIVAASLFSVAGAGVA